MIDAAICDGDIVTVRKTDSADHGDIVASLGQECGTTRFRGNRCSSAVVRTTIARATGVVISPDRANQQWQVVGQGSGNGLMRNAARPELGRRRIGGHRAKPVIMASGHRLAELRPKTDAFEASVPRILRDLARAIDQGHLPVPGSDPKVMDEDEDED